MKTPISSTKHDFSHPVDFTMKQKAIYEHKSWKTHTIYFMEKYKFSAYIEKPSFRYESEHRERREEKLTEEQEDEEEA